MVGERQSYGDTVCQEEREVTEIRDFPLSKPVSHSHTPAMKALGQQERGEYLLLVLGEPGVEKVRVGKRYSYTVTDPRVFVPRYYISH